MQGYTDTWEDERCKEDEADLYSPQSKPMKQRFLRGWHEQLVTNPASPAQLTFIQLFVVTCLSLSTLSLCHGLLILQPQIWVLLLKMYDAVKTAIISVSFITEELRSVCFLHSPKWYNRFMSSNRNNENWMFNCNFYCNSPPTVVCRLEVWLHFQSVSY